ncbi:hypothetical protein ACP275_13G135300 [Erythranthe tilingii]
MERFGCLIVCSFTRSFAFCLRSICCSLFAFVSFAVYKLLVVRKQRLVFRVCCLSVWVSKRLQFYQNQRLVFRVCCLEFVRWPKHD